MQFEIMESGNLALSIPDEEDRETFAETLESRGYWDAIFQAAESEMCNGGFTFFDSGEGRPFVGLTSAPCIAESMSHDEEGNPSIEGRLWYFADYMLRDDAEELAAGETVVYTLAQ